MLQSSKLPSIGFLGTDPALWRPPVSEKLMKSGLSFIGFFLLAMGLFWAGQGANLIRWPAESFMVNARQWVYYGGGTAVIGLVLVLLARR